MCPQKQIARDELLLKMRDLENTGLDCRDCQAPCCTFHYNSMRITEAEGQDLVKYLISINADLKEIKNKCRAVIDEYRLDKDFFMKPDARLRRHYTCPFFNNRELGCTIPAEHKPLGCLAFNPTDADKKGQTCKSLSYTDNSEGPKLEIPRVVLAVLEKVLGIL